MQGLQRGDHEGVGWDGNGAGGDLEALWRAGVFGDAGEGIVEADGLKLCGVDELGVLRRRREE